MINQNLEIFPKIYEDWMLIKINICFLISFILINIECIPN